VYRQDNPVASKNRVVNATTPGQNFKAGSRLDSACAIYIEDIYAAPISNHSLQPTGPRNSGQPAGFWGRIKSFGAGVALATLAIAVLIAALILGSVIAVVLAILLMIGIAIVIAR
jgi:hypothetical protein